MISRTVQELIDALRVLPGIGAKSAQRMAYYLLQNNRNKGLKMADSLQSAMERVIHCKQCNNFTEADYCPICSDMTRERQTLCVVAQPTDLIAIEQTGAFRGLYYVLMGHLSPIDGIGPEELGIHRLVSLVQSESIQEVILALNATIEGEATSFYLSEALTPFSIRITQLAQGIPLGGELEYIDSSTISRAIQTRKHLAMES